MVGELALKFVLGGAIVSLFSVCGEIFKPKHFAGIFGAAPSVALVSLAVAYVQKGAASVSTEARSMILGALAFYVYGAACVFAIKWKGVPVWLSAAAAWSVWLAVALGTWGAGRALGLLQ